MSTYIMQAQPQHAETMSREHAMLNPMLFDPDFSLRDPRTFQTPTTTDPQTTYTRRLHFVFQSGCLFVSDENTQALAYTGNIRIGGADGESSIELSRTGAGGQEPRQSGRLKWSASSCLFDLVLASGRAVPMQRCLDRGGWETNLNTSLSLMIWKGEGITFPGLRLVHGDDSTLAYLTGPVIISNGDIGDVELAGLAALDGELMDEIVLSAVGMLVQERYLELADRMSGLDQ